VKLLLILCLSLSLFAETWSVVYVSADLKLKKSDLLNIYFKKMGQKNGVSIVALNLSASHPARRAFLQQVLGSNLHEWDLYYDQMYFMGVKTPPVLKSPESMLKYLSKVQGAIGYIPKKNLRQEYIELTSFEL